MHGRALPNFGLGCEYLNANNKGIIEVALAAGITMFDTADCYGNGESEEALGDILRNHDRNRVFVCSKVGVKFADGAVSVHGDKAYIKQACYASLNRLQLQQLDILYLHRHDPKTQIEDSVTAMKELVAEEKVKYIGLSEVTADQIRRANKIHKITAVQIEYAPWSRHDENNGVIQTCDELGIAVVAYSPLGRGFFTENSQEFFEKLPSGDFRKRLPRYKGKELKQNLAERNKLMQLTKRKGCTLPQLILAWEISKGVTPIPGTTNPSHLKENAGALRINLTTEEISEIDGLLTNSSYRGLRYPTPEVSAIYPEKKTEQNRALKAHRAHSSPTLFRPCRHDIKRSQSTDSPPRQSKSLLRTNL